MEDLTPFAKEYSLRVIGYFLFVLAFVIFFEIKDKKSKKLKLFKNGK